jgi:hypothetical protein
MVSKGLAWFSHQIPTEGFSDVSEGRINKQEIPHSDQWLPTIGHNDSDRPDTFNRKNVMKDRNGRGVSLIIVEEIYQSGEYRLEGGVGLHNAQYQAGRFIYESPANWINAGTVNRTIALRRCDVKARNYNFGMKYKIDDGATYSIFASITSDMSIHDAMNEIARQMYKGANKPVGIKILGVYVLNTAVITTGDNNHKITLIQVDDEFWELLNVEPARRENYTGQNETEILFPNVWNRTDL